MVHHDEFNRLAYIGKLLHETLRLPVALIGPDRTLEREWGASSSSHLYLASQADLLLEIARSAEDESLPVIHSTNYSERALMLTSESWTLAIGPVLYASLGAETIQALMDDNQVVPKERERWSHYYRELPAVSKMQLVHAGMMLYYMVHGRSLEPHDILSRDHRLEHRLVQADELERQLGVQREDARRHHDPYMEERLHDRIRNGDKAGALQMLASFPEDSFGLLSRSSHLRNRKNLAIVTVTLSTRAAMEGGLFWELAYTLSDLHIQHIEDLREVSQVDRARLDVVADFAERVRQVRERQVSPAIANCQNYIFNHLYEEITLEHLERLTGMNGNYISHRFKMETGLSFRNYVLERRIEEARNLIKFTKLTFSEVATRLCFHDQSHFTKTFKKLTGVTPKQYRLTATGTLREEGDVHRG
ncbi:helix-turn-helix domain-containing protein [Cohnella yongneupensis]|uniref:Helix-turn-helix domain-containing protein n=1 Tax=Cohnella yongneupensis TaxID=425006 RepID=A0ABW0R382_9BACL